MKKIIIMFYMLIVFTLIGCNNDCIIIKYEVNGGNIVNEQILYKDTKYIEIIPTREGYNFIGWFTDPGFDNKYLVASNYEFYEDTTLYAKWEIKTYIVDVVYTPVITKRYYVKFNDVLELEELEIEGEVYKYFYYNLELMQSNKIVVNKDIYINAYYEELNLQ